MGGQILLFLLTLLPDGIVRFRKPLQERKKYVEVSNTLHALYIDIQDFAKCQIIKGNLAFNLKLLHPIYTLIFISLTPKTSHR